MKIYFAYDEKTGEFNGFYNDEIHEEIPKESVEVTEELQQKLSTGLWFINIEKLNDIQDVLGIKDKDTFFIEHEIESLPYIDPQAMLLKQMATNKLDLMNKDIQINNLTKQLAQNKIDSMKKDTVINNLMKQTAANKLEIMKMKGSNINE
ncbi:hypothetical protein QJR52_06120 [Clostridium baratii]|uniref:hypothetical protein n=1 Tax=Clostridium baratii TaxID=1561 RepID=UPI0030D1BCB6